MKEKPSITLSRQVLAGLKERERALINARDLEILNRAADRLSAEAEETFDYQADPWRPERE